MLALKQIHSLRVKAGLHVLTSVLEAQMLIAQKLADIPENSVLFSALTDVSDAFGVEKGILQREVDKLKAELSS